MIRLFGSGDIKDRVKEHILSLPLAGKTVVDIPAGNGETSSLLFTQGAEVVPIDLFPAYFKFDKVQCRRGDLTKPPLDIDNNCVDLVFCQEGLEHFSDQMGTFKEFHRILKPGGKLCITTPNVSHLRAKVSHLLVESEFYKRLPANEIDDIWRSKEGDVYYGHIFLINFQRLRTLAALSGFQVKKIIPTKVSITSLLLGVILYPLIVLTSSLAYWKSLRKSTDASAERKRRVYREIFKYCVHPTLLFGKHLFVELEKETPAEATLSSDYLKPSAYPDEISSQHQRGPT